MATVGELVFWAFTLVGALVWSAKVMGKKPCQDEIEITWGKRRDWARWEREWN